MIDNDWLRGKKTTWNGVIDLTTRRCVSMNQRDHDGKIRGQEIQARVTGNEINITNTTEIY